MDDVATSPKFEEAFLNVLRLACGGLTVGVLIVLPSLMIVGVV